MLRKYLIFSAIVVIHIFTVVSFGKGFDHSPWNEMLKRNVVIINQGHASRVSYRNFKADEKKLNIYLETLSAVRREDFDKWSEAERLAFLFNGYNAFTVKLILTKYPDLKSIKDLGSFFSSPWKKKFFKLFGDACSLDKIEHEMIRKNFKEPRVHFAVNCASIGCPMLLNEAFNPDKLNVQLEQGLKSFLSDSTRNTYNKQSNTIEVSKIFDWYSEDFEKGYQGYNSVADVFAKYPELLTNEVSSQKAIKIKSVPIKYLNYDWNLNSL
ncbi:MAG: hypothetical protein A4S09_01190 [Proteobacteria bacterium SG_bin7]|nr:MAG: hypothetical protein A4S09_01190 [Proteobacteria bacterium SG_bin7]